MIFSFVSAKKQTLNKELWFSQLVSEDNLKRFVRDLVGFGPRMGGTPSGDLASEYLAKQFENLGLQVQVVENSEKLVHYEHGWSLRLVSPMSKEFSHPWLSGFSPSAPTTECEAIYYDFKNTQELNCGEAKGKTVLIDVAPTKDVYDKLVSAGVKCILTDYPNWEGFYTEWAMITHLNESAENKIPSFNISLNDGKFLKELLQKTSNTRKVKIQFDSDTVIKHGKPRTAIATIPGKSDKYFLVCAHGDADSGGPGADDNASGVAGVLEIARVLQKLIDEGVIKTPKFSLKFIVWGSEYFSTEDYVKTHANELDKILGVFNYDEIGTGAARNCLYFESNDVPQNEKLLRLLNRVGNDYVGQKGFWEEYTTNPSQGGTDSYVFFPDYLKKLGLPEVKIPSTTIYTAAWNKPAVLPQTAGWTTSGWKGKKDTLEIDYSLYYHSSLDVPETTTEKEPFNMEWAVKATGIALLRLMENE